jgi:hypothetical protein
LPPSVVQSAVDFLVVHHAVNCNGKTVSIDLQGEYTFDESAPFDTEPTPLPLLENHKHLRLMFEMLRRVNEAPVEEHILVQHVLQAATDGSSFADAAIALHHLRGSRVLMNEGVFIVKRVPNGQQSAPFTSWRTPQTSDFRPPLLHATVFVPDETVFASHDILPWVWTTKCWQSKFELNDYILQLIQAMSSVTTCNFMAVAHALQESLGSVAHSLLMLLNHTEHVQPCDESCQLAIAANSCVLCGASPSGASPVFKCPHCRRCCICVACLREMHTPGGRAGYVGFTDQTDATETLPNFQYKKHSVDEFKWLHCCHSCGKLYPPSVWAHLTDVLPGNVQSQILEQMAKVVSRHIRYNEDPVGEPCMFACRREGCDRWISTPSRLHMVRAFCDVIGLRFFVYERSLRLSASAVKLTAVRFCRKKKDSNLNAKPIAWKNSSAPKLRNNWYRASGALLRSLPALEYLDLLRQ